MVRSVMAVLALAIFPGLTAGQEPGLQSFDQHLYELVGKGSITLDMALRYADSATDLKLKAKFSDTRSESPLSMPEQKSEASPQQETELTFKSSGNSFSDSDLTDDFR